jgi:hypothetical protein
MDQGKMSKICLRITSMMVEYVEHSVSGSWNQEKYKQQIKSAFLRKRGTD